MRFDVRCYALSILLVAQVVFTFYYILVTAPLTRKPSNIQTWSAISFVHQSPIASNQRSSNEVYYASTPVYLSKLQLDRRKYFALFNSSKCFLPGTDVRFSRRFTKCQCSPGWHGPDCGLPEVIWRAFIAARHKESPQRRERPRRIVCCIISRAGSALAEIFVQELASVVDLFVVNVSQIFSIPNNIKNKILLVNGNQSWHETRQLIPDLKHDDLLVFMADDQIPNSKALLFFKLYDGWPEPISFRLRWSVYGFFWQHPKRTILGGAACTAGILARQYMDNIGKILSKDRTVLTIGDLNHFGGWQCSWCLQSPQEIIATMKIVKPTDWEVSGKTIDTSYIEELIGSGLWVDGKTQLLRTSPSRDIYYAPNCVLNNSLKYDYLLQNIYARIDY